MLKATCHPAALQAPKWKPGAAAATTSDNGHGHGHANAKWPDCSVAGCYRALQSARSDPLARRILIGFRPADLYYGEIGWPLTRTL